jgi:hypothetical protein
MGGIQDAAGAPVVMQPAKSSADSLIDGGVRCVIFAARNHGASAMLCPPWSGNQTNLDGIKPMVKPSTRT